MKLFTLYLVESLDELEIWARKFFDDIKSRSSTAPKLSSTFHSIWSSDILYGLKAVEENHLFEVSWMIPPKSGNFYREKPENYLILLLGSGE